MLKEVDPVARESRNWGAWIFAALLVCIPSLAIAYAVTHSGTSAKTAAVSQAVEPAKQAVASQPTQPNSAQKVPDEGTSSRSAQILASLKEKDCFNNPTPLVNVPATKADRDQMTKGIADLTEQASQGTVDVTQGGDQGQYLLISATKDHVDTLGRVANTILGDRQSLSGLCNKGFYEVQFIVRGEGLDERTLYRKHQFTLADSYEYYKHQVVNPM